MLVLGINGSIGLLAYAIIVTMSTSNPRQIMWKLLQERRVIFVLLLLGILSYLDNFAWYGFLSVSVDSIIFSALILALISWDMISIFKKTAYIHIHFMLGCCYRICGSFQWVHPPKTKTLPWGIMAKALIFAFYDFI